MQLTLEMTCGILRVELRIVIKKIY